MNQRSWIALAFVAIGLGAALWRAAVTIEYSREGERIAELVRQENDRMKADRLSLASRLNAVETAINETLKAMDSAVREAKARQGRSIAARQAKEAELERLKNERWVSRWLAGSAAAKRIAVLEGDIDKLECEASRANLSLLSATKTAHRQMASLQARRESIEKQIALFPDPELLGRGRPNWALIFFGISRPHESPIGGRSDNLLGEPDRVTTAYSYEVRTIDLAPAPMRTTTLFDLLDVRSARDLKALVASFNKQLQDAVIRAYKRKEEGTLVDLTVGCTKVTLNKPVAEALWKKSQYFLAQTDFQCEIAPTSDFRDYLKQVVLKRREANGGPRVANPLDSKHVIGDAVDQSSRCQNQSDRRVPFDFDMDGGVIFVRLDGKGLLPANVVDEPSTRRAIVDRRKAEFTDDYKRLLASGGDLKSWEADQYRAALEELLWKNGMGIYGAHVMSFEAGLKAGLVGAYCSVQGGGTGGPRPDPIHSELTIGKSKAECGAALGGKTMCYRVDGAGRPDCWRGSAMWNRQIDSQRKLQWGSNYAHLYGPGRLDRYLSASSPGKSGGQ